MEFCKECAPPLKAAEVTVPHPSSLPEITAALSEARARHTVTAEILRVMSGSPTDLHLVFETIAGGAMRLCEAEFGVVARYDGELMHLGAHAHATAEGVNYAQQAFPKRPGREGILGRAILEGRVVHMPDVQGDAEYDQPLNRPSAPAHWTYKYWPAFVRSPDRDARPSGLRRCHSSACWATVAPASAPEETTR